MLIYGICKKEIILLNLFMSGLKLKSTGLQRCPQPINTTLNPTHSPPSFAESSGFFLRFSGMIRTLLL
ncbi:hypothetical protein L1887_22463 [Cichorium endivia]|nr:hypothetical protein L1887_22463 [Cichorium endivia]